MEEKIFDTKLRKTSTHRKCAVTMPPELDLSAVNMMYEESKFGHSNSKRTKSDSRQKQDIDTYEVGTIQTQRANTERLQRKFKSAANYGEGIVRKHGANTEELQRKFKSKDAYGEGSIPNQRADTEKLHRKFKSTSCKPDIEMLGGYATPQWVTDKKLRTSAKLGLETTQPSKEEETFAQRKLATTAPGPFDISTLGLTAEKLEHKVIGLRTSTADGRPNPNSYGEGAIPKRRPSTETLHRKSKSTSGYPDLEMLQKYASSEIRTKQKQETLTETISDNPKLFKKEEKILVEMEAVATVKRTDKKIEIHKEFDFRKRIWIPNEETDTESITDMNIARSQSESDDLTGVYEKGQDAKTKKVNTNTGNLRSNRESFVKEMMQDICKWTDLESLIFHGLFDSQLNLDDDIRIRSSSFGVIHDFNKIDKKNCWITKPSFMRTHSNDRALQELRNDKSEQVIGKSGLVSQKRKRFQRSVSDKPSINPKPVKIKEKNSTDLNLFGRLIEKSKSEQLFQGLKEKSFLHLLRSSVSQEEESCSSSEDLLSNHPKSNQKLRQTRFSQASMDSIEENAESPLGSPTSKVVDFVFDQKTKPEKDRKVSTNKTIMDKIKSETNRKNTSAEKNHHKIKRETSVEKLKNKKHDIDKKFQTWINHVMGIHFRNRVNISSPNDVFIC